MGIGFAIATLYVAAWVALTVVLGIVALVRKTRLAISLFGAAALSLPTLVLLLFVSGRFTESAKQSRQQSEANTAQEFCAEVERLPVDVVAPGGRRARVVLRPSTEKERYVMPVTAAAIAREFREIPRLCDKSHLVAVQDDLATTDAAGESDSSRVLTPGESFEICKERPVSASEAPPTTFALYFTLEKVVRLESTGGQDLRKFGIRLVDLTDMRVVKRSGVVAGPRVLHLPRACLDSAGQVAEFLRDALPR